MLRRGIPPVRRTAASLIACVCLAAQAFAMAHLFLVVHQRCAEHGEIEHGAHEAAPGDDHASHWTDGGGGTAADADHDHCQTFAERRDLRADRPAIAAAPMAVADTAHALYDAAIPARPRYLLAPKASPPAARS